MTLLTRVARLASSRPRRVLAATGGLFLLAVAFGAPAPGLLRGGHDFEDPGSEAALVREQLEGATGKGTAPGLIALVELGAPIDSQASMAKVAQVAEIVGREPVVGVETYEGPGGPARVSRDSNETYLAGTFRDLDDAELQDAATRIQDDLAGIEGVSVGGRELVGEAVSQQVGKDLAKAEALAFPIILALSFLFFRGFVAALMPLFVGVLTIFGSFLGLRLINEIEPLSVFAVNLVIALGLGLAIDYSLFIVSRYREEMARSGPGPEAIRRTLQTAGRTVLFSALTVAAALAALLVFPLRFLYSMGLGGVLAALIAAAVSLIALPALLALLGSRVNALAPKRLQHANERVASAERSGFWWRLSKAVMRRPATIALVTSVALLALGSQFLRIEFTGVSAEVLPPDSAARQVDEALQTEFPPAPTSPVVVTAEAGNDARPEVSKLRRRLASLPGVEAVAPSTYAGDGLWQLDVIPAEPPLAETSKRLVQDIRALDPPLALGATGQTAEFVDQQASLGGRLPLALAILCVTTLVLLFAMTGSVVLPIKSLLMNLLTLSAAFGLLVLIFQDGRLEGVLGYRSQSALEATQPVLLFAIAFGLSTDYAVFLLSRIKEARERGLSDRDAVAAGLERSGRIVTAAAVLFTVAIGAFATSQIIFIKEVGVGTALAVLIDATIIRALLVPSLMALLGRWNWWAPSPLRRLYGRLGLSET